MVFACATELQSLPEQLSGPSEPRNDECKNNSLYKPSVRGMFHMQTHESLQKNEIQWLGQDLRSDAKIADAYIKFKDEFIEMLSYFSRCETVIWAELLSENVEWSYVHQTQRRSILRRTGQVQFGTTRGTKCCRKEIWIQLKPNGQDRKCSRWKIPVPILLHRILTIKCYYKARGLPDTAHGWMYRLFWRDRSRLYDGCKQSVLRSLDQKQRSR